MLIIIGYLDAFLLNFPDFADVVEFVLGVDCDIAASTWKYLFLSWRSSYFVISFPATVDVYSAWFRIKPS